MKHALSHSLADCQSFLKKSCARRNFSGGNRCKIAKFDSHCTATTHSSQDAQARHHSVPPPHTHTLARAQHPRKLCTTASVKHSHAQARHCHARVHTSCTRTATALLLNTLPHMDTSPTLTLNRTACRLEAHLKFLTDITHIHTGPTLKLTHTSNSSLLHTCT